MVLGAEKFMIGHICFASGESLLLFHLMAERGWNQHTQKRNKRQLSVYGLVMKFFPHLQISHMVLLFGRFWKL
jgi:hypothetical protein